GGGRQAYGERLRRFLGVVDDGVDRHGRAALAGGDRHGAGEGVVVGAGGGGAAAGGRHHPVPPRVARTRQGQQALLRAADAARLRGVGFGYGQRYHRQRRVGDRHRRGVYRIQDIAGIGVQRENDGLRAFHVVVGDGGQGDGGAADAGG